jgi:hypothetical protein
MSDQSFIGVDITGITEAQRKLQHLPQAVIDAAMDAANETALNALRTYDPYRYVPRAAVGWASEKQRRYVMAAIRRGEITVPYKRTQNLRRGWRKIGSGAQAIIANEVGYAGYVMGDTEQARRFSIMPWRRLMQRIQQAMPTIIKRAEAAIKQAVKGLGL